MYENQSTLSDGGDYEQIVDGCTNMKLTFCTYVDTLRSTFFVAAIPCILFHDGAMDAQVYLLQSEVTHYKNRMVDVLMLMYNLTNAASLAQN
jgi:hypothetical protein